MRDGNYIIIGRRAKSKRGHIKLIFKEIVCLSVNCINLAGDGSCMGTFEWFNRFLGFNIHGKLHDFF